jgi:hypothetical protein
VVEHCNGWIASASQSLNPAAQVADCVGQESWNTVQQLAYLLGMFEGFSNPASNYVDSAYTSADPGAPFVEFATVNNIPFVARDRFVTFSVKVAAVNCFAASAASVLALTPPGWRSRWALRSTRARARPR